jgi:hypothetical protein
MNNIKAFVYKWTHLPTMKWYVGYHKGTPDDGYICSSKVVKPMILSNPDEWLREIIDTGEPLDMLSLETEILTLFNAKKDERSFNKHNGDGKWTTTNRKQSPEQRANKSKQVIDQWKTQKDKMLQSARNPKKIEKLKTVAEKQQNDPLYKEKHRASMKDWGKEHAGENSPTFRGSFVGTNIVTGEIIVLNGNKEIAEAGFQQQLIGKCVLGKRKQHGGYTWIRKNKDATNKIS